MLSHIYIVTFITNVNLVICCVVEVKETSQEQQNEKERTPTPKPKGLLTRYFHTFVGITSVDAIMD